MAAEQAEHERMQVQQMQKGDASGKLVDDGGGRGGKNFGNRRRARQMSPKEEAEPPPSDALIGNLLNLKV